MGVWLMHIFPNGRLPILEAFYLFSLEHPSYPGNGHAFGVDFVFRLSWKFFRSAI